MDFKKLPPLEDIEKEEQDKKTDNILTELFEPEDITMKGPNIQTDDIFKELFEPENVLDIGRQEINKQHVETVTQGINHLTIKKEPIEEIEKHEQDFVKGLDDLMRDDDEIQLY